MFLLNIILSYDVGDGVKNLEFIMFVNVHVLLWLRVIYNIIIEVGVVCRIYLPITIMGKKCLLLWHRETVQKKLKESKAWWNERLYFSERS